MKVAIKKYKYLLLIALGFHILVVTLLCVAGKRALWPNVINKDGIIISLGRDSYDFHPEVVALARTLTDQGIVAFARTPSPFHHRPYSISFALLSPLFGYTMLSVEPVNAFLYLVILYLIFRLSRLMCSRPASLIATSAVALWVSFLLHTTQLLRDPLFIAAMLALIFITTSLLTKRFTARAAAIAGALGVAAVVMVWMIRPGMREMLIAVGSVGGLLLMAKQIREKHFLMSNTLAAAFVLLACVFLPKLIAPNRERPKVGGSVAVVRETQSVESRVESSEDALFSSEKSIESTVETDRPAGTRVEKLRRRFLQQYPTAGSNIDTDVHLESTADIVRYIPRALVIGLFAPFPKMWFSQGNSTGSFGRLLSGIETLTMYVFELLAVFGMWKLRREWAAWLLLAVALVGALGLGMVVTNVGALYRMRYAFWMLIIILGAEGAVQLYALWREKRRHEVPSEA